MILAQANYENILTEFHNEVFTGKWTDRGSRRLSAFQGDRLEDLIYRSVR